MIDRVIAFGTRIVTTVDAWLQRYRLTRCGRGLGLLDHDGLNYAGSMAYFRSCLFVDVLLGACCWPPSSRGREAPRHLTWFAQNTPIDPDLIERDDRRGHRVTRQHHRGGPHLPAVGTGFFGAVSRGINRAFTDGKPLFILREKLLGILLILFSGGLIWPRWPSAS